MFIIDQKLLDQDKTIENLVTRKIRFRDMVEYNDNPDKYFRTAVTPEAALELFEHNEQEIREQTQNLANLWQDTSREATRVRLAKAALFNVMRDYINVIGQNIIDASTLSTTGLNRDSAMTIAEYQQREADKSATAHKRYAERNSQNARQWI